MRNCAECSRTHPCRGSASPPPPTPPHALASGSSLRVVVSLTGARPFSNLPMVSKILLVADHWCNIWGIVTGCMSQSSRAWIRRNPNTSLTY